MTAQTKDLKLVIKPYKSDNHLGFNAIVQCIDHSKTRKKVCGLLYVSFDHPTPRFLWEKAKSISASAKEYLELRAQKEAKVEIESQVKK